MKRTRLTIAAMALLLMLPAINTNMLAEQSQHVLNGTPTATPTLAASGPVNITITMGSKWATVGSNLTLSYSGVYDDTGETWNGTADFNITGTYDDANQKFYPAPTSSGTYAINVSSITDPDYGVSTFQVTPESNVVFDDVDPSAVAYYWETNVDSSDDCWLVWVSGVLKWEQNDTLLTENTKIEAYLNGTLKDYAYVDAYGQITDLWLGGVDDTWNYGNVSIQAENVHGSYDREFWSNDSITVLTQEIVDDGTTFTFAGAVAFMRNSIGIPNLLEIQIYNDTLAEQDHADAGRQFWVQLRAYDPNTGGGNFVNYTYGPLVTDADGRLYIPLNYTEVNELCNSSSYNGDDNGWIFVYVSETSIAGPWDLANRILCDRWIVTRTDAVANEEGIFIELADGAPLHEYSGGDYYSNKDDLLEYNSIIGIPNAYLWSLNGTVDGSEWRYTAANALNYIYVPLILDTGANFTLTVHQSLEANLVSQNFTVDIEIEPSIILDDREVQVASSIIGLSGTINTDATWNVTENGVAMGSGSVQAGSILVYWDRAIGSGDQNFTVTFVAGSKSLKVNGTYSKAASEVLSLDIWDIDHDDAYINIACVTSLGNATLYIYDNETLRATSPESEMVSYRKRTETGVHELAVHIDCGSQDLWKNFSYSIAVVVEALKIESFVFDTGSPESVSGQVGTNWGNTTVTISGSGGGVIWTGVEGSEGADFYFRKIESDGIHTVTLTVDGGGESISMTLAYSYRQQPSGGTGLPPDWPEHVENATKDALDTVMAQKGVVSMPPTVFAGVLGAIIIGSIVAIGQIAYWVIGQIKGRKKEDLMQGAKWM